MTTEPQIASLELLLREATTSVEQELALEDRGWINLSGTTGLNVLTDQTRIEYVKKARLYAMRDPLARQAIRLWTDYTFGTGMTWAAEDEKTKEALSLYWGSPANANVLSARGQRKSSDRCLIDGEIFFALFLGTKGEATIRRIDPLEITEIISDPDDAEDVRYYKRTWADMQGQQHEGYYKSFANADDKPTKDWAGNTVKANQDALVYHLAINTIGQRGNSLLLPVIDWIVMYRRFMASRVAIMLALARFAWKAKVKGGQTAVDAAKAVYQDQTPAGGSVAIENMGADLQPIRTDSNARNAYDDGRMLKLQVCAGVGLGEQYFGDISIGNLATAKTVELPMLKMFQSYQQVWADTYNEIDQRVLEHADVPEDARYVDRDFPAIAPEDAVQMAQSLQAIVMTFPELATSRDVLQQALLAIGVNDTDEVLDQIAKEAKSDPAVDLVRGLRRFRAFLESKGNGHGDLFKV